MDNRRRASRRDRLLQEIADLREVAFPTFSGGTSDATLVSLELERDAIVRGRVLSDCAWLEEVSALLLMHHWLSGDQRWRQLKFFGRVKKYRSLFDALGRLPARQKLTALKRTTHLPKAISSTVEKILALRDVLAHVLTLDDVEGSLRYKGQGIRSKEGFEAYAQDADASKAWFARKFRLANEAALATKRVE